MTPALAAHDLFCLYPTPSGHVAALRGLSLDVAAGERVVVHGPNGSGKTTLLRVLAGEQPPSAGRVEVAGLDLVGAEDAELAQLRAVSLGLVDQHHVRTLRPELDVVANVALQLRLSGCAPHEAHDRARAALAGLGLEALADRRPQTLSGGEAQRVAVCSAVAHGPTLVLADEPTGELDRASAAEVYMLLARATEAAGASLLLVTHDVGAARVADRVVRIRDGRLSEEWEPAAAPGPDQAHAETLVVDDRGWVRLPERLRRDADVDGGVRARADAQSIVLTPATRVRGNAGPSTEPAPVAPVPPVEPGRPVLASRARAADAVPELPTEVARVSGVRVERGSRVVLDGVDLCVPAGRLVVLKGPSGSGKTTLLRVMTGLERPDAGEVVLAGVALAGLDRDGLADVRRALVSVAGQGGGLVDALDVEENLGLARDARGLSTDDALVAEWVDRLGLHPLRHRRVGVLSGGERQRALVARVLVSGAALAVLDEPTSQQDEANAERVVAALAAAAAAGTAVVAATHDPVLVEAADQVHDLG